ncbi:MFS transporter [Phenylobacterium sp.]|uniref:MFS transporter n=1 Tax=Phenylobacterium sp. TaxID=1871053 RepID=UPI002FDB7365
MTPESDVQDERELARATTLMMVDSAAATAVTAVTSGIVLAAFALYLGASNSVIGLLAALPFLTQLIQAPAVPLVEKLRRRRAIAATAAFCARLNLPVMAAIALLPHNGWSLTALVVTQLLIGSLGAVTSCAWNSWVRDLIPEARLGAFTARRTLVATAVTLSVTILSGVALDRVAEAERGMIFAAFFAVAFLLGLVSVAALARTPEPPMPPPAPGVNLLRLLRAPLRDENFRRLIFFLSSWQFAVNLASPFFTVYFVSQLNYPITFVIVLSVVSQAANIAVLRTWGQLSDRFSNKSVLHVAAPAYILCIAATALTSQIDDRQLAAAYLIGLHVAFGAAAAGVGLATVNIALKLAPRGAATAYIAANTLITSLAAAAAPILGGLFADFFAARELQLLIRWSRPGADVDVLHLAFNNWDFYFLMSALLGLYALHRLTLVREAGEVEQKEMVSQVMSEARRVVANLSPVAGLKMMQAFPAGRLMERRRRRRPEREAEQQALAEAGAEAQAAPVEA